VRALAARWFWAGAVALGLSPVAVSASVLVVPDDVASIQAAVDAAVETVLVRPGAYDEDVVLVLSVVLRSTSSDPDSALPSIATLRISTPQDPDFDLPTEFHVERFGVRGSTTLVSDSESFNKIRFSRCALRNGISDVGTFSTMISSLRIEHCTVSGILDINVDGRAVVDSCRMIQGRISSTFGGTTLIVRDSEFIGAGGDIAIHARAAACSLVNNVIRNWGVGIDARSDQTFISDNQIEGCAVYGIQCTGEAVATNNHVRNQSGIGIAAYDARLVAGNHVTRCAGGGIVATPWETLEVRDNVVAHSRWGLNLNVTALELRITSNTMCYNRGPGFFFNHFAVPKVLEVTHNLSVGNATYGAEWTDGMPTLSRCNDWYGNALGAVSGAPLSPDDLSIVPAFCDTAAGDFHLAKDSPLLDWPACGRIGALGQGCALTSTLVERFTARRVHGGVEIRWRAALDPATVVVQRASGASVAWTTIATERRLDGHDVIDLDRDADPSASHRYRLAASGMGAISEAILVPGAADAAILSATPNPARARVEVRFVLERAGEIAVGVFDLQGRQLAELASGRWEAGVHAVRWNGSGAGRSGVFFVRYRHAGGAHVVRVVRAR
jgi:hypothetical protein